MTMFAIPFPMIDPVLISLGPFDIRWYALAYIAGIILGWWYLSKLNKKEPTILSQKALDDIIVWAVLGIIVGGRLGYVGFYNFEYYSKYPGDIIKVWQGGMSFHGGVLGFIFFMYLFCLRHKVAFLPLMDLLACVAPIGLFFGRIANFINNELYGTQTTMPWGVIFPGTDGMPRHPSQIYEALLEGALLFVLLRLLVSEDRFRNKAGFLSGAFLLGYAACRSIVEVYREPDHHIGYLFHFFTMGQILSIPMVFFGILLLFWTNNQKKGT